MSCRAHHIDASDPRQMTSQGRRGCDLGIPRGDLSGNYEVRVSWSRRTSTRARSSSALRSRTGSSSSDPPTGSRVAAPVPDP